MKPSASSARARRARSARDARNASSMPSRVITLQRDVERVEIEIGGVHGVCPSRRTRARAQDRSRSAAHGVCSMRVQARSARRRPSRRRAARRSAFCDAVTTTSYPHSSMRNSRRAQAADRIDERDRAVVRTIAARSPPCRSARRSRSRCASAEMPAILRAWSRSSRARRACGIERRAGRRLERLDRAPVRPRDRGEALAEHADRAREQQVAGRKADWRRRPRGRRFPSCRARARRSRVPKTGCSAPVDAGEQCGELRAAMVDHRARHRFEHGLRDGNRAGKEQQRLLHANTTFDGRRRASA